MENLYDVAKYFLELDGRLGKMRLNRLLFYAQAWHLAKHKKPLFKEDFRVWKTGPVCKELDVMFGKEYETGTENPLGDSGRLKKKSKKTIEKVSKQYSNFPTWLLGTIPTSEKPFQRATENHMKYIPKKWLKEYYGTMRKNSGLKNFRDICLEYNKGKVYFGYWYGGSF